MPHEPTSPQAFPQQNDDRSPPASAKPRGGPWWRVGRLVVRGLILVVLLTLTGWNLVRSEALGAAEAAYEHHDYVAALRLAKDHLAVRPWSRSAERIIALCLSRLDYAAQAEPYYRKLGPLDHDDWHVRAYGLVRANQRQQAEQEYRKILEQWPDDPRALRRLAAELMTQSRWKEALEFAQRLAVLPTAQIDGLAMIAAIEHQRENPEGTVAASLALLEADPQLQRMPRSVNFRRAFWGQLGQALMAIGRAGEARRDLERGLADVGETPDLLWLLGKAYHLEGELDTAEGLWKRAAAADPELPGPWLDLGQLALARGRPEEAIPPLRRAAALMPDAYPPVYNLALAYRRLGDTAQAERFQRKAEQIRRQLPPPTHGMGAMPSQ